MYTLRQASFPIPYFNFFNGIGNGPAFYFTKPDYASKEKREKRYFFTNYNNQMISIHLVRILPFPAIKALLVTPWATIFENVPKVWKDGPIKIIFGQTKDMQLTLKNIMGKVEVQGFDQRLGIVGFDSTQIGKFRNQCKNIKLRHMYLRLVHRDFYTKERMLRFRMSLTDACERCGEIETFKKL